MGEVDLAPLARFVVDRPDAVAQPGSAFAAGCDRVLRACRLAGSAQTVAAQSAFVAGVSSHRAITREAVAGCPCAMEPLGAGDGAAGAVCQLDGGRWRVACLSPDHAGRILPGHFPARPACRAVYGNGWRTAARADPPLGYAGGPGPIPLRNLSRGAATLPCQCPWRVAREGAGPAGFAAFPFAGWIAEARARAGGRSGTTATQARIANPG